MKSIVNDALREELLKRMIDTSENIYLVFSYDEERTGVDSTSDLSRASIASVDDGDNISTKYAMRIDDTIKYAIKKEDYSGSPELESATINGIDYVIDDDLDNFIVPCTAIYFIKNAPEDLEGTTYGYNTITVIKDLKNSSGYIDEDFITDFGDIDYSEATIVMQTRPANKDIEEDEPFYGLISF